MSKIDAIKKNGFKMMRDGSLLSSVVKGYVSDLTGSEAFILDKLGLFDRINSIVLKVQIAEKELVSKFSMGNIIFPDTILGAFYMLCHKKRPISHKQVINDFGREYIGGNIATILDMSLYDHGYGEIAYEVSLSDYLVVCFDDEPGEGGIDDLIIQDCLELGP